MAKSNLMQVLKTGIVLVIYVAAFTLLMVVTYEATKDDIAKNKYAEKMGLITETLPAVMAAQKPELLPVNIEANQLLKTQKDTTGYQIAIDSRVQAVVLEAVAKGGYGGDIRLLIAVSSDLSVLGVRVLEHKETPSIGDYVAEKPSDKNPRVWTTQFDYRSLQNPPENQWAIRKDGGQFDYMAGATVSARAVVPAVKQTLLYVTEQRERFFGQQP